MNKRIIRIFLLITTIVFFLVPKNINAQTDGWYKENGNTYYLIDGVKQEGFTEIDGKTYFFGIGSARLLKGWQSLGPNKKFYLYEDGSIKEGWQKIGKETYYVKDNYMLEGFQEIDGKTYFFGNTSARLLKGWQSIDGKKFYLYEDGSIKEGWQKIGKETYYVKDNFMLEGFQEIDGKTYFFGNTSARLLKGWQSLGENKKFYLYEDGSIKEGWQEIGKETYYVKDNFMLEGFQEIDGKTYFFGNTSARLLKGWQSLGANKKFYLYEDGSIKEGWQEIGKETYYVKDNFMLEGFQEIDGKTYFFGNTSARLLKGWQSINNNKFYLYEDGSIKEGWQIIADKKYYVKNNFIVTKEQEIDGHLYKFNSKTGELKKGLQTTSTGKKYFIDENYNQVYEWLTTNDETYYFSKEDGYAVEGFNKIGEKTYFFGNTSGKLLKGWQSLGPNKKFYLYEDGSVQEGWQTINKETYYVKDNYMLEGFNIIDEKKYLFGITSARLLRGWQRLNDNIYYAGIDGVIQTGNHTIEGRDYIFNEDGILQGFKKENNKTYYINPDGTKAKGVERLAGLYYKFDELTGEFEKYVNQKKVIDISSHNGDIDWQTVKNSGQVDAVILRLGYGTGFMDKKFLKNISELNRLAIPYSVYLFSYAENKKEAEMEAKFVVDTIKKHPVRIASDLFSIYYDLEDWYITSTGENSYGISQETYKEMIETFTKYIEQHLGIKSRVYASKNYINTRFPEEIRPYATWVAEWNPTLSYKGPIEGWQYTSDGSIPGINARVDLNIFYY